MVRFSALLVALTVLLTCTPALATVECVQQELARIGLDPGPIDGSLGPKTMKAARLFQDGASYLSDLSEDTSYTWCELLKEQPPMVPYDPNRIDVGSGTVTVPAMDVTPVLGLTREYEVPTWVNNPHGPKK